MTDKEEKSFIIEGKLFWACVHKVNSYSGKYQVDVSIDDKTAKKLQGLGVTIKQESEQEDTKHVGTVNDRKTFVTVKRNTDTTEGKPLNPPVVIDAKKQPVPMSVLLGNGTKAKVKVNPYEWKFKNKKGISLGFSVVQVLDLVEYSSSGLDGFEEEEGYTTTNTITESVNMETDEDGCPFSLDQE